MLKKLLNLFGRKRFDKIEKVAPSVVQRIDDILFQTSEIREFPSDGAGSLTLTEEYKQWEQVKSKITDDMTPREYNKVLVEEYGNFEDRARNWTPKEVEPTYTFTYSLDDLGNVRVNKE